MGGHGGCWQTGVLDMSQFHQFENGGKLRQKFLISFIEKEDIYYVKKSVVETDWRLGCWIV